MMGGVSPEACWAIKKQWNNKFFYTVAPCWFFLWDLYYDAQIHEHQTYLQVINPLKGWNDSNTRGWSRKIQISFMIKLVADWPRGMPATVRCRVFVFQLFKIIRIKIYRTIILPFLHCCTVHVASAFVLWTRFYSVRKTRHIHRRNEMTYGHKPHNFITNVYQQIPS